MIIDKETHQIVICHETGAIFVRLKAPLVDQFGKRIASLSAMRALDKHEAETLLHDLTAAIEKSHATSA